MNLQEIVTKRTGKAISQCSNEELYFSLLEMTKGMAEEKVSNEGKRKLYYSRIPDRKIIIQQPDQSWNL